MRKAKIKFKKLKDGELPAKECQWKVRQQAACEMAIGQPMKVYQMAAASYTGKLLFVEGKR